MRTFYTALSFLWLANLHADIPLSVTASLTQAKVERRGYILKLHLIVKNTSSQPIDLHVMNCSWFEHWKSDKSKISIVAWNCAKNFAVTVVLKSQEIYAKDLEVCLLRPVELPYSFKMGFTPIGSKATYWSDNVQVNAKYIAEQDAAANP